MELCLKKQYFVQSFDRICQNRVVGYDECYDFLTKKKRPVSGASARRYYRWGGYILVNSMKNRLKSQIVIDNPGGLNHVAFNNTRHASPLDAHLGGFFCLESTIQTL